HGARLGRVWMLAERCVCQVRCGTSKGTGFLVGRDLVLTCFHVVRTHLERGVPAADVQVRFDYRAAVDGSPPPPTLTWQAIDAAWSIPFSPVSSADVTLLGEPADDELDYAVLRLASPVADDSVDGHPRGWVDISVDRALPPEEAPILIAQHPSD